MRIQRVALHLDRVASDIKKASKDIRAIELILEKEKLVDDHPDVIPNLKEGLTKLDKALQFIANASNLLVPKKALPMPVISKIDVGEFNVGDRLRVTDPGYEKKSSLAACFPALPGKWLAGIYVDPEKQRVMRLFAHHADHPAAVLSSAPSATISVDAGQVGFFDDQRYPRTFDEDFCDKVTNLVDLSAGRVGAGILEDYGVASLSGYGDGQYNIFVAKMDDVVVSVCVVFIGDDDARP